MGSVEAPQRTELASPFRTALIDLCFERGFAAVTVEALCHRAGLDRPAFESLYADLEDCFFQICLRRAGALPSPRRRRSRRARRLAGPPARHRLRVYRYLDEDERLRRFTVVEAGAAGERPALLIDEEIEELSDLIDEGRAADRAPDVDPDHRRVSLAAASSTRSTWLPARPARRRARRRRCPKLMYSAVLPYLGAARAAEELEIPPPPRPADG